MSGARSRVRVRDSRKMNSQELRQVNITNNCHFHTLFSLKTRLYKIIHILLYSRLGKIFSQIMIIIFFHLNRRKKHHTYLVLWEKILTKRVTLLRGTQVKKIIVRHHTGLDDECVVKSPITASFSLVKAFALIDIDGDGCITSQELVTVIEKVMMIKILAMTWWWTLGWSHIHCIASMDPDT